MGEGAVAGGTMSGGNARTRSSRAGLPFWDFRHLFVQEQLRPVGFVVADLETYARYRWQ